MCLTAPGAGVIATAQNVGKPPISLLDASDIYTAFRVRLNDGIGTPAGDAVAALQVGVRAKRLGITSRSALDAWTAAQSLVTSSVADVPVNATATTFTGSTASALNAFVSESAGLYVRVSSASILVDQPIAANREGLTLDLAASRLSASSEQIYMIRVVGAHNVTLKGGVFTKGNSAILVSNSAHVVVEGAQISDLSGDGIVVTASTNVTVARNHISGLGGPGIVLNSGSSLTTIVDNEIRNGLGQSNWAAGILVTDRDTDLAADPRAIYDPGGYWANVAPVRDRIHPPRDSLIASNHISTNASSGIYMDGGVKITVFSNVIEANAKEGLCLDNGATANVVTSNIIQQNGSRWGQTDETLHLDFVGGRLPDGTAAAKVPGISIDNGIYNVVYANNISHNSGGGVKMVRTGYFNILGMNIIENDNDGASDHFRYFGVELGAASSDAVSLELDFTASRGNVIFSNLIRGSHGSGVFIGSGSDENNIFNNIIMDARDWAIESLGPLQNTARDNFTNVPSLNADRCCALTRPSPPRR